ncbi:MAG: alpha/beta hydrolase [Rhodopirellula sp.]|nr:alpha/beta hydrolase [Rhodopirellula sp.]
MSYQSVNGTSLYYEVSGDGPETIVFAHGCLLSCRMFDEQVSALRSRYRCVTFDFRGQGQSAVSRGGYEMDYLAADTAALIRSLDCGPCHFLGFSMGGFVGMRLAAEQPELIRSLILVGTSASRERQPFRFRLLCWLAWLFGVRAVTRFIMPVQFGPAFLRDSGRTAERQQWFDRIAANDRVGSVRATHGVIRRADYSNQISLVQVPTMLITGKDDVATPPTDASKMHSLIAGSELVVIPDSGHAVTIEKPLEVTALIESFLQRVSAVQPSGN